MGAECKCTQALFRVNLCCGYWGQSSDELTFPGRRAPACPSGRLVVVGFAYSPLPEYERRTRKQAVQERVSQIVTLGPVELSILLRVMSDSRCQVHCNTPALTALQAPRSCAWRCVIRVPEKGVQNGQCDNFTLRTLGSTPDLHKKVGNPSARWVMNPGLVWIISSISPACALLGSVCRSSKWLRFV